MGKLERLRGTQGAWIVAAAVAVLWVYVAPTYWIFTVTAALLVAISALGLSVVGWVGEFSLAQAGLTGIAVYVGAYAYRPPAAHGTFHTTSQVGLGWPFLAAAALAIGVVVLLSVVVSLATSRLSGVYIMVLTLGLQMTIERAAFTNERLTGGINGAFTPRPAVFGFSLGSDRAYYFLCLAALGAGLFALARLRASRAGRALLLVGVDRQAAASVGVSPWGYKIFAFAIAGFFAGVAGMLTGPLFGSPPSYVSYLALMSLFYLAIPVLAGFRSLPAVVVVAVAFGLAPQALERLLISPLLLGGLGLFAGTLAGPAGVGGLVSELLRKRRRSRPEPAATEIRLDTVEADSEAAPRELSTYLAGDER